MPAGSTCEPALLCIDRLDFSNAVAAESTMTYCKTQQIRCITTLLCLRDHFRPEAFRAVDSGYERRHRRDGALQNNAASQCFVVGMGRNQHQSRLRCEQWTGHKNQLFQREKQSVLIRNPSRSVPVPGIMFKRNKMSSNCLGPEQDQTVGWRCRLKCMRTRCEKPRAIVRDSVKRTRDIFRAGNDFIGCGNCYCELAPTRIRG